MTDRYLGRIDAYLLRAPNAEHARRAAAFLRGAMAEGRSDDAMQLLKALESFLDTTSAPAAIRKCAAGLRADLVLLSMEAGPRDAVRDLAHIEAFIKQHSSGAEMAGMLNRVKDVRAALMATAAADPPVVVDDSMRFRYVADFAPEHWEITEQAEGEGKQRQTFMQWQYTLSSTYGATEWEDDVRSLIDSHIHSLSDEDQAALRRATPPATVSSTTAKGGPL